MRYITDVLQEFYETKDDELKQKELEANVNDSNHKIDKNDQNDENGDRKNDQNVENDVQNNSNDNKIQDVVVDPVEKKESDKQFGGFLANVKTNLKLAVTHVKENMVTDDKLRTKGNVDDKTGRVYSRFGNYSYRLMDGFEYQFVPDRIDDAFDMLFKSVNTRYIVRGYLMLYKHQLVTYLVNYENYWLDVFRPYDEYDTNRDLNNKRFMYGFQCFQKWLNKRSKVIRKEKDTNL